MSLKARLREKIRKWVGYHELLRAIKDIPARLGMGETRDIGSLEVLPGTPYSRFALPVDYLPSRDFKPRWGYSKPLMPRLEAFFAAHASEYESMLNYMRGLDVRHIALNLSQAEPSQPAWLGGAMSPFDELALYAMVVKRKPGKFFEVGSGISTCFARRAARDAGLSTRIVSIDPEPRAAVDAICDVVRRDGLETIDIDYFDQLEENDILYIDGSHRSFVNSDVTVLFIDVLSRLRPGVIVHLHDITLPWDYPEMFLHWYWNEQYLLAVYLLNGMDRVVPLFPTAYVCRDPRFGKFFNHPFIDVGVDKADDWRGGGSFWFTTKG
jgi:hypothetical protein